MSIRSLCLVLPLTLVAWSASTTVAAGGWHAGSTLLEAVAKPPVELARRGGGGFAPMRMAPMRGGGGGGFRMPSTAPRGGYGMPNANPFQSPFSTPMGSRGRPPAMMPYRPPVQTAPARPTEPLQRLAPASITRPPLAAPRSPLGAQRLTAMTDSGRLGAAGGVARLLAARAGLPRATPSALGGPLRSAAARSAPRLLAGAAAGGLAAYALAPRQAGAGVAPANPSSPLERSNRVVEGIDRDGDFRRYRIREFVRAEGTRLVSWRHVTLERHRPAMDAPVARAWAASAQRQSSPASTPGAQEPGRGEAAGQRSPGDAALRYGVRRTDEAGTDLWLWVMDHPLSPGFGARHRVDDAAIQRAQVSVGAAGN